LSVPEHLIARKDSSVKRAVICGVGC